MTVLEQLIKTIRTNYRQGEAIERADLLYLLELNLYGEEQQIRDAFMAGEGTSYVHPQDVKEELETYLTNLKKDK